MSGRKQENTENENIVNALKEIVRRWAEGHKVATKRREEPRERLTENYTQKKINH